MYQERGESSDGYWLWTQSQGGAYPELEGEQDWYFDEVRHSFLAAGMGAEASSATANNSSLL